MISWDTEVKRATGSDREKHELDSVAADCP